jgi:hypothetical protein
MTMFFFRGRRRAAPLGHKTSKLLRMKRQMDTDEIQVGKAH